MEPRRVTPPPWLPATRPPVPPPVPSSPDPGSPGAGSSAAGAPEPGSPSKDPSQPDRPATPKRPFSWRKLTRSRRGAAGLVIAVAALLLWPFSGWSVIPWLAGIGLLVLLRLLRLDGLLRGWVLHLGGLVVVAGLMLSTGPWAWALAASIGVLLAGLAQLPWWRLAAVGAALCLVSGIGFGFTTAQSAQEVRAAEARTQLDSRNAQGAERAVGVLPIILNRIAQNVPGPVCDNLLAEPARTAFTASTGAADCNAAVAAVAAQVTNRVAYARADAPSTPRDGGLVVDACAMSWGSAGPAGPQLGRLTIGPKGSGSTYVVTEFSAC